MMLDLEELSGRFGLLGLPMILNHNTTNPPYGQGWDLQPAGPLLFAVVASLCGFPFVASLGIRQHIPSTGASETPPSILQTPKLPSSKRRYSLMMRVFGFPFYWVESEISANLIFHTFSTRLPVLGHLRN